MQTEDDAPAWTIPVSCNWGELAAQGSHLARLTNVAIFPAGSDWLRAGFRFEQCMQELRVLELNAFLAFKNGLEQAVATSWSGNLMLLNCNARATPSSSNLAGTDTQTSQVQAHSVKLTSQLKMQSSTAVRSGAALLGQAASPQELPGAVATADVPPGVQSVPSPSISVLLVDVYYLRDWVPSRNLEQSAIRQLADHHGSTTCALILAQHPTLMQALQPLPAESTAAKQALTTAQPRNQADGGSFADLQQGPPGNMASAALPQPAQTKYTEQDASAAGGVFASQALSDKQFDNTIEDKTTPAYQSDSLGQCTDRTSSFAMPCATKTPESSAITAACSLASVAMEDECQSSGSTDKLQMCGIYHHAQSALIFFKTLKKRLTGADLQCLQDASAITQLFVLSAFAAELKADRKPAVFVRTTWRRLCADGVSVNPALILQTGQSVFAKSIVHLLARAWKAGVFEKRYIQSRVEAKLKCLPRSLHWAAACYAIGVLLEMSNSQQALPVLEAGIDQMQQVLVDARPA